MAEKGRKQDMAEGGDKLQHSLIRSFSQHLEAGMNLQSCSELRVRDLIMPPIEQSVPECLYEFGQVPSLVEAISIGC